MSQKPTHRYNFQPLNKLLTENLDPDQVGDNLDEILPLLKLRQASMNDLVTYTGRDDDYPGRQLSWHYFILRTLRDFM